MDKCEKCNKHKQVFKNTDTNEKLCLWCGIKMQYELQGIKGVFRTLKFHIKSQWILSWEEKLIQLFVYIAAISLTLTSISSFIYICYMHRSTLVNIKFNNFISCSNIVMEELIQIRRIKNECYRRYGVDCTYNMFYYTMD